MKKLKTFSGITECHLYRSVLKLNGIDCFVRNDDISPLSGVLPLGDAWPELWIYDDDAYDQAMKILEAHQENK